MLTAHDYASACYLEKAGNIDMCLVGDSLAMVTCGYTSTVQLTMDEMLYHCRAVARGARTPMLVADMPFGSYQASEESAIRNACRLIQEGDMEGVKIEGGVEIVDLIDRLASLGIAVMAQRRDARKPAQSRLFPRFLRGGEMRRQAADRIALGHHPPPGIARGDEHHLHPRRPRQAVGQRADLPDASSHHDTR